MERISFTVHSEFCGRDSPSNEQEHKTHPDKNINIV
jgi:hypothetical protein